MVVASGNGATTARAVARRLDIDEVHLKIRSKGKVKLVADFKAQRRRVPWAGIV